MHLTQLFKYKCNTLATKVLPSKQSKYTVLIGYSPAGEWAAELFTLIQDKLAN